MSKVTELGNGGAGILSQVCFQGYMRKPKAAGDQEKTGSGRVDVKGDFGAPMAFCVIVIEARERLIIRGSSAFSLCLKGQSTLMIAQK